MCKCLNSNFPIIISVGEKKKRAKQKKNEKVSNNATIEIEFLNELRKKRKRHYDKRLFHSFEVFSVFVVSLSVCMTFLNNYQRFYCDHVQFFV